MGSGGGLVKMWATFLCASMMRCCKCEGRFVVLPGLYASRSLWVKTLSGWRLMPQHPASSYLRDAKKSCVPGGGLICLLCTSYVACIWSYMVVAGDRCGSCPYVVFGVSVYASVCGGSRWGGFVMWHRLPIWFVLCRYCCMDIVRWY